MHNPPLVGALQVFRWVFSDIPGFSQERIDSETKKIAHQGHGNDGDSSYGLAAFNFMERHLDPSIPSWSGQCSQVFWDHALHDLVLYHITAKESSGCILDWMSRCVPTTKYDMLVNNANGFCEYNDYNLYSPRVCGLRYCATWKFTYEMFWLQNDHPIYLFLDRQRKLIPILSLSSQTKASLPPVSALMGQHPDVSQMHTLGVQCSHSQCSQSIEIISVVKAWQG